jgi:16S rRNA (adenine1518-N6/adenine1519-N6)-dimethyltransferase
VVGNLPYYISKPILMYLLENRAFISLIVLLVQSEVAERLIAPPRSRSYGALSVFTQFYSEVEIEFKLSKTLFYPPPKVNSSVVRIIPKKKLSLEEKLEEVFTRVVKASFQKRRKMLKNSLKSLGISERALKSIFQKTNINPQVRAEELSESDFVKLTRAVYQFLS